MRPERRGNRFMIARIELGGKACSATANRFRSRRAGRRSANTLRADRTGPPQLPLDGSRIDVRRSDDSHSNIDPASAEPRRYAS